MRSKSTTVKSQRRGAKKTLASAEGGQSNQRRQRIMAEAAHLFATRGFDATTIRDIASAAGILGGSVYYHFASKEEIFLAVHTSGMEAITKAVEESIAKHTDPWDRLMAAAMAHCESLLSSSELPVIVSPYYSQSLSGLREELVKTRDRYETIMKELVAALDLPPHINRHVFRLHFLGAMNWVSTWYKPDSQLTPSEIGRQLVMMIRHPA